MEQRPCPLCDACLQVKSVSPAEAARLVQEGKCRILDVRTAQEFADVRPEGAVNAQFYRLIKEWTPRDILRRAGFAFFGVFNGTEENPEFLAGALPQQPFCWAGLPAWWGGSS